MLDNYYKCLYLQAVLGGLLYKLMETLYSEVKGQRCMLTSIVNQYLLSNKPNIPDRRPSYKSMKSVGTSSQELLDGRFLYFFE